MTQRGSCCEALGVGVTCHWWLATLRSSYSWSIQSMLQSWMGPVELAVFPLVVQLAASVASD